MSSQDFKTCLTFAFLHVFYANENQDLTTALIALTEAKEFADSHSKKEKWKKTSKIIERQIAKLQQNASSPSLSAWIDIQKFIAKILKLICPQNHGFLDISKPFPKIIRIGCFSVQKPVHKSKYENLYVFRVYG